MNRKIYVSNCSISGYISSDVKNIFNSFLEAYSEKARNKESIIVFEIWTNDASLINWSYKTSPDIFRKNLIYLLDMCNTNKIIKKVFFLTCPNCDEEKIDNTFWVEKFKNSNIEKYNIIIKEVCEENNREFLDVFWILEESDFYDWLHPNSLWHEKIFKKVYDFLETRI